MDAATLEMVLTAHDETVQDAQAGGHSNDVVQSEGMTAARCAVETVTPRARLAAA
ncbi:hypothetical protein CU669_06640 [Paramagnetospirillum kuznetsovii]|uniref:Uncharacterized protein n=1 Tax=Paramagnetospirillum kuznetsovii TaxID=2053833 RepID=A0A364P131_9PROT|nr:hypothetical protein [Paramagnetospirillum kuznetsovii]RAU23042.1 hypothetical protein CU669_06640 [Paramagnetospirillum kuznetsovii]